MWLVERTIRIPNSVRFGQMEAEALVCKTDFKEATVSTPLRSGTAERHLESLKRQRGYTIEPNMNSVEQVSETTSEPVNAGEDESVDVLDILLVLVSRRRFIGLATLSTFLLSVVLSLLLRPNFTATALIMPPQQSSSSAGLLSQLGSLAAMGGGASASLGLKTPADMYVGILQSRTIADEIISRFKLKNIYKTKKMQDTRAVLKSHTTIESGKDGLIQISVVDHDAQRASDLANAYVAELYSMNSNLAITEAAQRRVFFDQQLDGEKKALATAEEDLRATQQKTGLIQLSGQALMIIQSIGQLRAQIASREVELQSVHAFATDQNPEVTRLNGEISTMRQQLAKLENDQQGVVQPGNIALPAGRVAEDSLEYSRKLREVKYHETLFDLLSRQYEAARIDEAKSAPIIQVIDQAVPPDTKSGPHGSLIALGFTVVAFLLSSAFVYIQAGLDKIRTDSRKQARWVRLKTGSKNSTYTRR
jgi:tyrosine-protein kinase Etk/Wzc